MSLDKRIAFIAFATILGGSIVYSSSDSLLGLTVGSVVGFLLGYIIT